MSETGGRRACVACVARGRPLPGRDEYCVLRNARYCAPKKTLSGRLDGGRYHRKTKRQRAARTRMQQRARRRAVKPCVCTPQGRSSAHARRTVSTRGPLALMERINSTGARCEALSTPPPAQAVRGCESRVHTSHLQSGREQPPGHTCCVRRLEALCSSAVTIWYTCRMLSGGGRVGRGAREGARRHAPTGARACCSWENSASMSNTVNHFAFGWLRQPAGDGVLGIVSNRARNASGGSLNTTSSYLSDTTGFVGLSCCEVSPSG